MDLFSNEEVQVFVERSSVHPSEENLTKTAFAYLNCQISNSEELALQYLKTAFECNGSTKSRHNLAAFLYFDWYNEVRYGHESNELQVRREAKKYSETCSFRILIHIILTS